MKAINADTNTIVEYVYVGPGKKQKVGYVCQRKGKKILLLPRLFAKVQLK